MRGTTVFLLIVLVGLILFFSRGWLWKKFPKLFSPLYQLGAKFHIAIRKQNKEMIKKYIKEHEFTKEELFDE